METRDSLKNVLDLLDKDQLKQMGSKAEKIFQKKYKMERMVEETIRLMTKSN